MAETLEAQLERVQLRIAAIEDGVSEYQTSNKRLKNHELTTLYAREKDLINRIAMKSSGNTAYMGRQIR